VFVTSGVVLFGCSVVNLIVLQEPALLFCLLCLSSCFCHIYRQLRIGFCFVFVLHAIVIRRLKAGLDGDELVIDLLRELLKEGLEMLFAGAGILELHGGDVGDSVTHGVANGGPGDLAFLGRGLRDDLLGLVMELTDHLHHTNSLGQGAHEIVFGETVLLQEIFTDDLGALERDLLILRQGVLTDELDNLHKIGLDLQDLRETLLQDGVLLGVLVEETLERLDVLGERDVPVDGGEMLTLGELLVETPEHLDNGKSGRGNGIGEITTGRRDGTDDSDGTDTVGGTKAFSTSGTLVESGKTGAEVGGVTTIGGHLCQTTTNFTKCLGPSRGGISHHSNVLTLITEVLSDGDTGVDRGLTSSHRHVGCVGNQTSSLHDTFLLAIDDGHELGEFHQHLSHFVTALSATDVSDDIRVRELGEGLGNDSLTATEGTGDGAGTTLSGGEEGIQNTLTGKHRTVTSKLLGGGSALTHGPVLLHGQLLDGASASEGDLGDDVCDLVGTLSDDALQCTGDVRGNHDAMLLVELGLVNVTENVTTDDNITGLDGGGGGEVPHLVAIKAGDLDTSGDVDILCHVVNVLEGALNTIEDGVQNTRSELKGEGLAGLLDGIADGHTGGVLVNLNGGGVFFETNDLSDKSVITDTNHFVHTSAGHARRHDERSCHLDDGSIGSCFSNHDCDGETQK